MIMPSLKVLLWFNSSQRFNYNFAFPKGFRLRLYSSFRFNYNFPLLIGFRLRLYSSLRFLIMIMPSLKALLWFNSSQRFNYNFPLLIGFRLRLCPSRRLHRRGDHIVGATRAGRADRPGPDVGRDRQVRIPRTDLGRTQTRAKINDGISHSIPHRWVSNYL